MTMVRSLLLTACLSCVFVLTDLITFVRVEACPDEQLPALIGLPFVHRTSVPWVNSLSGVLYVKGLLLNVIIIAITFASLGRMLHTILPGRWLQSRSRVVLEWSTILGSILIMALFPLVVEWDVQWSSGFDFQCPERTLRVAPHFG
jgi:hypothetical protein